MHHLTVYVINIIHAYLYHINSALSQYVHNIDALNTGDEERKRVDGTIDQLYEDIEKGNNKTLSPITILF